jgi:hypothetical protein
MSLHDDGSIDVSEIAPVHLELEAARAHEIVGPYGAYVGTMAPTELAPPTSAMPLSPYGWHPPAPRSSLRVAVDSVLDALAAFPLAVWKRVALYSFLFMLFGNLLRCRGLSTLTNVSCGLLVVIGLLGVVACCSQRSP